MKQWKDPQLGLFLSDMQVKSGDDGSKLVAVNSPEFSWYIEALEKSKIDEEYQQT